MPGVAWSRAGLWGLGTIAACYNWRGMEMKRFFISPRVQSAPAHSIRSQLKDLAGMKESEGERDLNLLVSPDNSVKVDEGS